MGHSYTMVTVKLLFATARTCAFPGCLVPLVFVEEDRGVREVAVQIAHIRSPRPDGPRYDPDFPRDQLSSDGNLLLLCGVHHHPVDRNSSKYAIPELLEWKKAQTAGGGGFTVQDDDVRDLVSRLESLLDELVQATRLQMQVRLVGGRIGRHRPAVARMNLDGLDETERTMGHRFRPGRLIGVETENQGVVGADVQAAGIDIDLGHGQPGPWPYSYPANGITPWEFPCRVEGHATRAWFETGDRIRGLADWLYAARRLAPQRFRPWAELGNGERLCGQWTARADLPIWEPGVGEAQLRMRFGE